jgi:hypothetical protein
MRARAEREERQREQVQEAQPDEVPVGEADP